MTPAGDVHPAATAGRRSLRLFYATGGAGPAVLVTSARRAPGTAHEGRGAVKSPASPRPHADWLRGADAGSRLASTPGIKAGGAGPGAGSLAVAPEGPCVVSFLEAT